MNQPDPRPRTQPPAQDKLIDKFQVAQILGGTVTPRTVIRRWKTWNLTAYRVGRELRFYEADVHEWIKNNRVN